MTVSSILSAIRATLSISSVGSKGREVPVVGAVEVTEKGSGAAFPKLGSDPGAADVVGVEKVTQFGTSLLDILSEALHSQKWYRKRFSDKNRCFWRSPVG